MSIEMIIMLAIGYCSGVAMMMVSDMWARRECHV